MYSGTVATLVWFHVWKWILLISSKYWMNVIHNKRSRIISNLIFKAENISRIDKSLLWEMYKIQMVKTNCSVSQGNTKAIIRLNGRTKISLVSNRNTKYKCPTAFWHINIYVHYLEIIRHFHWKNRSASKYENVYYSELTFHYENGKIGHTTGQICTVRFIRV